MTKQEFKWSQSLSQEHQIMHIKAARKALGLTQTQLGDKLRLYGYRGGRATVQKWEQGLCKIPVLVYELMREGFAERKRSEEWE